MADTSAKKILIVDDDADIRAYLEALFTENGYEVVVAFDGHEGFQVLKDTNPDLVTLDLQMPNETGAKFYRKKHKDEELDRIPVIVISGLSGRHLAVGEPAAVFEKPIDEEKLLEAVRKAIG